jgi:heme exporter protein D
MLDLGTHSAFILASYAVSLIVVAGAISWVMVDYKRQKATLADLEERGVTRRSARQDKSGGEAEA